MAQLFPPDFGPIAPERNPPITPQYYVPRVFYITALVRGPTTTITTNVNHNYVIGQTIRLVIPPTYGASPLNEQQGNVIAIPAADQVVVTIDSSKANPFIPTPTYGPTPPQILPIGDILNGGINNFLFTPGPLGTQDTANTVAFIPGSFINVSPAPGNTANIPTP